MPMAAWSSRFPGGLPVSSTPRCHRLMLQQSSPVSATSSRSRSASYCSSARLHWAGPAATGPRHKDFLISMDRRRLMRSNYLFTSESVSEGHPDKVADQISDALVDYFIGQDPEARVACETLVTTQRIVVGGEIRCRPVFDEERFKDTHGWAPGARDEIEQIVRHVVQRIGYEQDGFHWQTANFDNYLHGQSAHIAQGVDASGNKDEGAGDQGIMFGFACDETPDLMPATLYYSHKILERMAADPHSGVAPFLEPDAKSQVTLRFDDGKPAAATAIVVSTQHKPGYDEGDKESELKDYVRKV